jgi:glycosyltransferase involved in cell wall biosynthesis
VTGTMRILIVHSRYLSGPVSGENAVVDDEARLLREAGHTVELWQPEPTAIGGVGLLRTGMDAIWNRQAIANIQQKTHTSGAEIIHFHNLFPALSPAALRATGRAASVMTLHNYRLMCLPSTFLRDERICEDCLGRPPWRGVVHRCYRDSTLGSAALAISLSMHRSLRTFDRITLFVAVSEFVRRKYIEAGFPNDRIRVKSNFVWPTERREGPGEHFLFLGRLSPEKGARTIIDTWSPSMGKLLLVGEGPEASQLRRTAPRNVEFVGSVPQHEVSEFLRGARALLVPSLWYEAQPRVILEAYAAGVPVIASRIGGLPDLVVDGTSGLLVLPADSASWVAAVEQLLDDQQAQRFGEGAYRLWAERHSPEQALGALEDTYRMALTRN